LPIPAFYCNNNKGADLGTLLQGDQLIRFFNPRKDHWSDHFELSNHIILPKTDVAKATIKILGFNQEERLAERLNFLEAGYFPHPNAIELIST